MGPLGEGGRGARQRFTDERVVGDVERAQAVEPCRVGVVEVGAGGAVGQHRALARRVDQDDDGARAAHPADSDVGSHGLELFGEPATGGVVAHLPDESRPRSSQARGLDDVGGAATAAPGDHRPRVAGRVHRFQQMHDHVLDQIAHRAQHGIHSARIECGHVPLAA